MTSPEVTDIVVRDCAQAGIRRVWMYRAGGAGAASSNAVESRRARGIAVVPGECPFMFLPKAAVVHRLHGFLRRVNGRYPRRTGAVAA